MLLEREGGSWILEVIYSTSLTELTHDRDIATKGIKLKSKTFKPIKGKMSNKNIIIHSNKC